MQSTLNHIDRIVENYHLLKHPFYQEWRKGNVTLEVLKQYAVNYHHLTFSLPDILTKLTTKVSSQPRFTKQVEDEKNHIPLFEEFCYRLGLTRDEIDSTQPIPELSTLLTTFETATENIEKAAAAFYVYESQLPALAREKKNGLIEHYGFSFGKSLEFFDVHENEEEHISFWRQLLIDAEPEESLITTAEETARGLWDFLTPFTYKCKGSTTSSQK